MESPKEGRLALVVVSGRYEVVLSVEVLVEESVESARRDCTDTRPLMSELVGLDGAVVSRLNRGSLLSSVAAPEAAAAALISVALLAVVAIVRVLFSTDSVVDVDDDVRCIGCV